MLAIVVMGVSGCGKSTVGRAIANALDGLFFDGDDYHPAENIAKMSAGIPLTDEDRQPWLERLRELLAQHLQEQKPVVLACSALKQKYRTLLRQAGSEVRFVYLKGDFDTLWERMSGREGHFMPASMLHSQLATLEPPTITEALTISILTPLEQIVTQVKTQWGRD